MEWNENMPALHKILYIYVKRTLSVRWKNEWEDGVHWLWNWKWTNLHISMSFLPFFITLSHFLPRSPIANIQKPSLKDFLHYPKSFLCRLFSSINWLNRYRGTVLQLCLLQWLPQRSAWIALFISFPFLIAINNYLHWFLPKKMSSQPSNHVAHITIFILWYGLNTGLHLSHLRSERSCYRFTQTQRQNQWWHRYASLVPANSGQYTSNSFALFFFIFMIYFFHFILFFRVWFIRSHNFLWIYGMKCRAQWPMSETGWKA